MLSKWIAQQIAQEPLFFSSRNSSTSNPFHTENIVDCTFPKWWLIREMVTDEDDDGNTGRVPSCILSLKPSSRYSKPNSTIHQLSTVHHIIPLQNNLCIFSAWFIPYPINSSFPPELPIRGLSTHPQSHCFPYHPHILFTKEPALRHRCYEQLLDAWGNPTRMLEENGFCGIQITVQCITSKYNCKW